MLNMQPSRGHDSLSNTVEQLCSGLVHCVKYSESSRVDLRCREEVCDLRRLVQGTARLWVLVPVGPRASSVDTKATVVLWLRDGPRPQLLP